MERLKMETPNIANENFQKLAEMFPNAVTEAYDENGKLVRAIDKDVLMQEISCEVVDGKTQRYRFQWPDKNKAILTANTQTQATLRPCKEESVDFDNTQNIYIEGDNLEVLKVLRNSYKHKIKMIYIDPPYNTGHDFVYNDNFSESIEEHLLNSGQIDEDGNRLRVNLESNGRFHTDWLNFIYPRLRIARDLLTEDGVIFISIDDNELENLTKICNEIFGESNFVGCICRATGTTTGQDANKIGSSCDYCLVYSRTEKFTLNGLDLDEKDLKRFNEVDDKGRYSILQLRKTGNADTKEERPNMFFPVIAPDGTEVYPFGPTGYLSRWRVSKESYLKLLEDNMIVWKKSDDFTPITTEGYTKSAWTPYVKYYLEGRTKQVSSLFQDIEGNKKASIVLKNLLGSKGIFDNPKPVEFIKILIQIATNSDDYVMDFFSGSATTAHALMQFNVEKGGNRKFIMVQIPEKTDEKSEAFKAGYPNICEIGKERIRRAGKKIKEETGAEIDYGFRVFKISDSNMKEVFYTPAETQQTFFEDLTENIKEDRTSEDLLFQVMLELGLKLSHSINETEICGKRVFNVNIGNEEYLYACFEKGITDDVVKAIALKKPYYAVFRDSGMDSDSTFENFEQIFKKISPETTRKVL